MGSGNLPDGLSRLVENHQSAFLGIEGNRTGKGDTAVADYDRHVNPPTLEFVDEGQIVGGTSRAKAGMTYLGIKSFYK